MIKVKWYYFLIIALLLNAGAVLAANRVVKAGDIISVWVKGEPDLSVEKQVGRDGSVTLPLIGSVGVNGLKTVAAARLIAQMYEDGFLRSPMVQVSIKSASVDARTSAAAPASTPPSGPAFEAAAMPARAAAPARQVLVEVVDAISLQGIGGVAMMLGNRIYQSNRLGQILVDALSGHAVVIADGFETVSGDINQILVAGDPGKIQMRRIQVAETVTFQVIDASSKRPLRGVEVILDEMKVRTNRQGSFKVSKIKKEFGEILLKRRGYKTHRQVIDYKGPEKQIIKMVKNE